MTSAIAKTRVVLTPLTLVTIVEPAGQEPKGGINPPDPDPITGWVGLGRVRQTRSTLTKKLFLIFENQKSPAVFSTT